MNKIVNWTFGGFFRTIGRFLAFIGLGILFSFILNKLDIKITDLLGIDYVYAEEIGIYAPFDGYAGSSVCDTNGKYNYDKNGPSAQGRISYAIGNVNSTISGRAKNFLLFFKKDLESGKTYDVTINFTNYDLMNNVTSSKVYLYSTETCANYAITNQLLSLMSVSNKATSSQNANKIKLRIYAGELIGNWAVEIKGGTSNITSVSNFGVKSVDLKEVDTSGNNAIINNNTQNTENIINNNNENTQEIINNQNQNTQDTIDSQKVCKFIDKSNIVKDSSYFDSAGNIITLSNYGITDYIKIISSQIQIKSRIGYNIYFCFYNDTKNLLSCDSDNNYSVDDYITIPSNSTYVRFSILKTLNRPTYNICTNGNQALNDTLNDDDISSSQSEAGDFFGSFTTDTHGLTGIITAPLSAIQSLTSATCSPLVIPLPFVDSNLTLPCMRPIYEQYFGGFMSLYDTITIGIIGYWVCVRIFAFVKDFKNPEHDEIEVVDL